MDQRRNAFLNIVLSLIMAALVVYIVCDKISAANRAEEVLAEKIETHDRGEDFLVVHDLYAYSDEYLDKNIAITGLYSNSLVQEDGSIREQEPEESVYHFLTVFDTAGDCFYTIEFVSLTGEYPVVGDLIYISGVFSKYTENDLEYITIANAEWSLLDSNDSSNTESDEVAGLDADRSQDASERQAEDMNIGEVSEAAG